MTSPQSTSTMLLPASWPGRWAARMAVTLGWSAQGRMLTPLEWVTTTVFEHVDAIFSTSSPFQSEVEGGAVFAFCCPAFQKDKADVRGRWEQSFKAGLHFVSVSLGVGWGNSTNYGLFSSMIALLFGTYCARVFSRKLARCLIASKGLTE